MAGVIATAARAAEPPPLDIPESALNATLTGNNLKIVEDFTGYWAGAMLAAKADDAVLAAKAKLVTSYSKYDSTFFKSAYALSAAKALQPVLDAKGPLKGVLQVNAGQAIAAMPQLSVLPLLEKMAVNPEAVVRYYAWRTCKGLLPQLASGPKDEAKKLFALVGDRMGKEKSGEVLGMMFQLLNLAPLDMSSASDDFRALAASEPEAIVAKNWPALCRAVVAGDEQAAAGAHDGVHALVWLSSQAGADKARVKADLQEVVDMMWCAALAYDRALAAGKGAEGTAKAEADARAEAMAQLLMDCETDLNAATGKKNAFVQAALSKPNARDRGADVQLAVVSWVENLKDAGVVQPAYSAPPAPASAPSGGPG